MKLLIPILLSTLLLASCSKVDTMESQNGQVVKNTDAISKMTAETNIITNLDIKSDRKIDTRDARTEEMQIIDDKNTDMSTKLTAANAYFETNEYQLWSGVAFDTEEYREELIISAVEEFFRKINSVYIKLDSKRCIACRKRLKSMSPLSLGKGRNSEKIFYALAAKMHVNNSQQEKLFENAVDYHKLLSIYDIIKSALIKDISGATLERYEEIVITGINKDIAIALINARANFSVALAVESLVDKRDIKFGDRFTGYLFQFTDGRLGKIKLESLFEESNQVTKIYINNNLSEAIKARRVLYSLDIEFKLDKRLKSILENLVIDDIKDSNDTVRQFFMFIEDLVY